MLLLLTKENLTILRMEFFFLLAWKPELTSEECMVTIQTPDPADYEYNTMGGPVSEGYTRERNAFVGQRLGTLASCRARRIKEARPEVKVDFGVTATAIVTQRMKGLLWKEHEEDVEISELVDEKTRFIIIRHDSVDIKSRSITAVSYQIRPIMPPPIRVRFKMLVFQDGQLDEEVETGVHTFAHWTDLESARNVFSAMNGPIRMHSRVRKVAASSSNMIHPPEIRLGLGPSTHLVISEVIWIP